MISRSKARIVILGAGFAGVQVARTLAAHAGRDSGVEITLVDQNNFFLFTPMLTEVASGQVDMLHIVAPMRGFHSRINFLQGRVTAIDLSSRWATVTIGGTGRGDPCATRILDADHLVIALGSVPDFYGIPGLRENSLTMNNLCDAAGIRNRALALLERANAEPDPELRRKLLTFVVGGGGFSGVETAAALHDLVHDASAYYPNIGENDHRIVVIEALDRLLPDLSLDLSEYALRKLRQHGSEVMLNTKIVMAGTDYVDLEEGKRISAGTIIWTGGVEPTAVVKSLDCEHIERGNIVTDATCAVKDRPGVWALGDCAAVPQAGSDEPYAPTAQNAVREGERVARNILAVLRGRAPQPFTYKPVGELAALGKRSGVASIKGIHLSGFIAWFLWRTVYLLRMPRLSQQIRVGLDWALDLVFGRQVVEEPTQCFVAGVCPAVVTARTGEEQQNHQTGRNS